MIPYPTKAALSSGANPEAAANAPAVIIEGIPDSKTAVLRAKGFISIEDKIPHAMKGMMSSFNTNA